MKLIYQRRHPLMVSLSRGMTLTEILVVLLIVIVLAVIGFQGAIKMRDSGHSAVCVGNLKQLGGAILMYSADHGDKLLPLQGNKEDGSRGDIWPMILAKAGYLWDTPNVGSPPCGKGVWTCPKCDFMSNAYGGYGIVEGIFTYPEGASASIGRMSNLTRPSSTWLVGDAKQSINPKKGWYAIWQNPSNWAKSHGPASGRHGNRVNVCMFDGHVESITIEALRSGRYTYPIK